MNATEEMTRRLDVADYVEEVRSHLSGLAADDREELVDGLEADLTERLLETDPAAAPADVFGAAAAYAAELRGAAGFPSLPTRGRQGIGPRLARGRERLAAAGERPAVRSLVAFAVAMRPAWWVIRAWIALQVIDMWFGSYPHSWMISVNGYGFGGLLLLAAIAVSVQIGRGEWWWPSSTQSPWPRRLLLGLNVFAIVAIPFVLSEMPSARANTVAYDRGWAREPGTYADGGLRVNGEPVQNVYAYDAQGDPIIGVQLFDQDGKPLGVSDYRDPHGYNWATFDARYPWPWTKSEADDSTNVFPIPERRQPMRRFDDRPFAGGDPAQPVLPFAQVPALSQEAQDQIALAIERMTSTGGDDAKGDAKGDSKGDAAGRGQPERKPGEKDARR